MFVGINLSSSSLSLSLSLSLAGPQYLHQHTTVGIRWWSHTQLLIHQSQGYVWQRGRDALSL